jgi:hypothetical protein
MILFRHLRSFIIGVCAGVVFRAGWLILRRRNLTAKKKEPKMIREDITKEDFEQYVRDIYNTATIADLLRKDDMWSKLVFKDHSRPSLPHLERHDFFAQDGMFSRRYGLVLDSSPGHLDIVWEIEDAQEPPAFTGPCVTTVLNFAKRYERTITDTLYLSHNVNWAHLAHRNF